jgi:hypothetical protein
MTPKKLKNHFLRHVTEKVQKTVSRGKERKVNFYALDAKNPFRAGGSKKQHFSSGVEGFLVAFFDPNSIFHPSPMCEVQFLTSNFLEIVIRLLFQFQSGYV